MPASTRRRGGGHRHPGPRARFTAALWVAALRLQRLTWRVHIRGLATFDADLAAGRPLIAAFWHGRYVPLFVLLAGRDAAVFSSRSRRGAVIGEICRRFGYRPVLIEDHGGEASLAAMRRTLAEVPAVGVAVDGPLGPYHAVKRGAVQLAAETGCRVYPVAVASSRKRVLAQRWDRMELPRLFSRVALVIGEPLLFARGHLDDPAPGQRELAAALAEADRHAATLVAARRGQARPP